MSVDTATIDGYGIHRVNNTFLEPDGWGGLGSPEVRSVRQPRPRAHGVIDTTALYGARIMPVRGWCALVPGGAGGQAAAIAAFDALKAALSVEVSHLAVIRRTGRAFDEQMVVRRASDISSVVLGGGHVITWATELVAADPRLYATTLQSQQRTGAGSIAVSHGGTTPTPAYIQIEGPTNAGALTITNSTTGEAIALTGLPALAGGALLDVDTLARTVYYGSVYHPEVVTAFSTYWWSLVPGANTVTVSGTALAAGTITRVRWRDARI